MVQSGAGGLAERAAGISLNGYSAGQTPAAAGTKDTPARANLNFSTPAPAAGASGSGGGAVAADGTLNGGQALVRRLS